MKDANEHRLKKEEQWLCWDKGVADESSVKKEVMKLKTLILAMENSHLQID